jgi:putative tryptophan/tyrosine transport system substrate-binding protein
MRRREFIAGLGSTAAWPMAAQAQRGERVRRLSILSNGAENDPGWEANRRVLLEELAKLGWIEADNLRIEFRFGAGHVATTRAHAVELVRLAPDVIVTSGNAATRAAQQATRTIPIVMAAGSGDPEVTRMFRNLARPDGNITGFSTPEPSIAGKWLELLKEAAPHLSRVALLYNPETGLMAPRYVDAIKVAAPTLSVETVAIPVRDAIEIVRAVDTFAAAPNGGLIVLPIPSAAVLDAILPLTLQYRLPAIYQGLSAAAAGGLMAYGADITNLFRLAASYVDRLLRGAKVDELPVQFPTKFRLVVNLKAAKAIGLSIPEAFLLRADEVIE